jgi:ABC-2 type transport system ATP-binding protein
VQALELRGVVKRLPGPVEPVLDGLDLHVPAGGTIGVVGANGAGKTTMLRVASGLLRPDRGTVAFGGLEPEHSKRAFHSQVALLSADGGLYARLSVRRHLEWWAALAYVPRAQRAARIAAALDGFALGELAARRVERLSAGQRQRVRLAMTFLPGPAVLLLDEPDSRLDDEAVALLARRLAEHSDGGGIAVWTAPEGRAPALARDALLLLDRGRLEPLA